MNDLYSEARVIRKSSMATYGMKALMVLAIIIGLFIMVFAGKFGIIGVAMIVMVVFFFPKYNLEYEYVFVDGQLDFDRIIGQSRRKTLIRIDLEQVDMVVPMNSPRLDQYQNMQVEKKDYSSGQKKENTYVILTKAKAKHLMIMFEPSEKMLRMMKQKSPRKVEISSK